MLHKLLLFIDGLNEWCGRIFCFLSLVLMVVVLYDVAMRYFFNLPTIWGMEMSNYLLAGITFLGAGYCLLHNGHVKVDILYANWSRRRKAAVDICTYIIVLLFCLVLIFYGGEIALSSWQEGRRSTSIWGQPLWPGQLLIPVGALLLILQVMAKWLRDWVFLLTGKEDLTSKLVSGENDIFTREEKQVLD